MTAQRAVVFVADQNFVIPTIVSALQVKAQVSEDKNVDIYVFLSDLDSDKIAAVQEICDANGLVCKVLEEFILPQGIEFNVTHVSKTSLARFLIARHLSQYVQHVLYLDGDIQIEGDIRPLIYHDVREGYIAAANDRFWLGGWGVANENGQYLEGLGVDKSDYFNAGVFAIGRPTFELKSAEALNFYLHNSKKCRFHDQSALNVVFKSKREILDPTYNFITEYRIIGADRAASPKISHFTGGIKPWLFKGPMWFSQYFEAYVQIVERYPALANFRQIVDAEKISETKAHFLKNMFIFKTLLLGHLLYKRFLFKRYRKTKKFCF